jgi:GNAT superfamily N-acetyltransferase
MVQKTIGQHTYLISTDKSKLDLHIIHNFLSIEAYWCKGIPFKTVQKSIEHAFCFGMYCDGVQIGFARVVTDFATIAYLGDVFIVENYRKLGLSKWLIQHIMRHEKLQGLRRWILITGDAHGLYRHFGWDNIEDPIKWMEIHPKNLYQ